MSPGLPGASVTSPGPPRAVKVEMNADSPPAARLIAPSSPPFICDWSSIFADIETIAPASAWMDCSAASCNTANANDGCAVPHNCNRDPGLENLHRCGCPDQKMVGKQ